MRELKLNGFFCVYYFDSVCVFILFYDQLLLWRVQPQSVAAHEENRKSRPSFSVHVSSYKSSL